MRNLFLFLSALTLIGCYGQVEPRLQGLWMQSAGVIEKGRLRSQVGEVYHYFGNGEFLLVYCEHDCNDKLERILKENNRDVLSDEEFVEAYSYSVVDKYESGVVVRIKQSMFDDGREMILRFGDDAECYELDVSMFGDFDRQRFCKVGSLMEMR